MGLVILRVVKLMQTLGAPRTRGSSGTSWPYTAPVGDNLEVCLIYLVQRLGCIWSFIVPQSNITKRRRRGFLHREIAKNVLCRKSIVQVPEFDRLDVSAGVEKGMRSSEVKRTACLPCRSEQSTRDELSPSLILVSHIASAVLDIYEHGTASTFGA